ncbi:hypothetical protein B4907_03520 [Yersinia kristensenii]|nr:hypothetical protein B4907_03520 [Yersinia kristensenii]
MVGKFHLLISAFTFISSLIKIVHEAIINETAISKRYYLIKFDKNQDFFRLIRIKSCRWQHNGANVFPR